MKRIGASLALAALLLSSQARGGSAVNNPPTSGGGGGGGAVSSVTAGSGCVTVSPTTGAVIVTSSGCQSSLTFSTGLTNTAGTITDNLATGKSGGQTAFGDTLTTGNLTLRPNAADSTTGRVVVSGLGLQVPDGTSTNPSVRFTSEATGFYRSNATELGFAFSGGTPHIFIDSISANTGANLSIAGAASAGLFIANSSSSANIGGFQINAANTGIVMASISSGCCSAASVRIEALFAGGVRFPNISYVSFGSSSTPISSVAPIVMEYAITPAPIASGSSVTLDAYKHDATTVTFTGTTGITTATGVNFYDYEAPTYTDASALTITNAATLAIKAAPVATGSVTITNPYALWVQGGTTRLDGPLSLTNTLATPGSGVVVTTDAPTAVVSLSLKYITATVNGTATYILALQ